MWERGAEAGVVRVVWIWESGLEAVLGPWGSATLAQRTAVKHQRSKGGRGIKVEPATN